MNRSMAAVLLSIPMLIIGAAAGGTVAALFSRSGMGYDAIASALTGVMAGAIGGIAIAIMIARRVDRSRLGRIVIVAAVVALALVAYGLSRTS